MASPFDPNFLDPVTGGEQNPLSDILMGPPQPQEPIDPMAGMAGQPVPYEAPRTFLQQIEEKITSGILGTGIPRIAVSAGLGAVTGAGLGAPMGGIGAVPGALLGAAVGALSDILGASADVATARALGPEGVELGFARISPELAGMMADLGVGILAGGTLFSKAGRILGPTAKRLEAMGLDEVLGGTTKLSKPYQLTLPRDPMNYFLQHPEAKAAQRIWSRLGLPADWDNLLEPPAAIADDWNKLMRYGPTGADPSKPIGAIKAGVGSVLDAAMNTRLFRFANSPWRVLFGDPNAMEILRLKAAGELMARPVSTSLLKEAANFLKPLNKTQRERVLRAWHAGQGPTERDIAEQATKAAKGTAESQIPLLSDAPPTTSFSRKLVEAQSRTLDILQRTGATPEEITAWRGIAKILEEMGNDLVAMKKLDPKDLVGNYLPFVREKVMAERAQLVELAEGYFPIHIESQIKGEARAFFLNRRRYDIPPKEATLEELLNTTINAFSRVVTNSVIFPRIKELMPLVSPQKADYVAALFNYYVGHPSTQVEHLGKAFTEIVKTAEFWRTMGASILSPIVNTTQRLNILGMVDVGSFMKGLIPNQALRMTAKGMGILGRDQLAFADIAGAEGLYAGLRKGIRDINRAIGLPFFWSENSNKIHAFQAGFYHAKSRNWPESAALQYGAYVAERTQFASRIGRTPEFARNDLGSVVGQFKTFAINQLGFTEQLIRSDPRGAARFMLGTLTLFGTDAIAPGADLEFTRRVYGKPFKVFPGLVGYMGAALADQTSMWGLNYDDMQRIATNLPGPAFEHVQSIAAAITGINMGNGTDLSDFGMPLTPDQRASKILRSAPIGGSQANRFRMAAKLFKAGEVDRAALTLKQALGAEEAEGPLHQKVSRGEAMMKAMGLTSQRMFELNQLTDLQRSAAEEYRTFQGRMSDLRVRGRNAEASQLLERFKQRYPEISTIIPSLPSLKEAMERRVKPGSQRLREQAPRPVRAPYEQAIRERELQ